MTDEKIKHYTRLFEIKGISQKTDFFSLPLGKVNSLTKYCKMDFVTKRSIVELWKTNGVELVVHEVEFDSREASTAVKLLQLRKEMGRSASPLTDAEQARKDAGKKKKRS